MTATETMVGGFGVNDHVSVSAQQYVRVERNPVEQPVPYDLLLASAIVTM